MNSRPWFDAASGIVLLRAALCALMFCSGCLRHTISISDGYRIDEKGGVPMLVSVATPGVNSPEFQTVMVTLPAGPSKTKFRVRDDCAIQGSVFSMHSGSSSDNGSWVIQSPSTSGWDTLAGEVDINAQWKFFTRELARMDDRRCFPSGLATQSIRTAIAKKIPLPASEVPIFMYSDQGERFVNLAPGMEIRIQWVLPANSGSCNAVQIQTATYDVGSRHDGGVSLKRSRGGEGKRKASLGTEDRQLLTLDQRFARTSALRLFLQGFSEKESESGAILIGTSDETQLDVVTDLLRQRDRVACINIPGAACTDLPSGSVSLFSLIWINGRRTTCPFGTSLASLLLLLPPPKQSEALESVQVVRQLSLNRYAGIQFTRTVEGARQLLLLPGDRIDWKN